MMDWKEQIELGMKLIKMGCENNGEWSGCTFCPFDEYCDKINEGQDEFLAIADIFKKNLKNSLMDKEVYIIT